MQTTGFSITTATREPSVPPKKCWKSRGVPWDYPYNAHKDDNLDPAFLQAEVKRLLTDSEVQKKSGIYAYLLTGEEKHLNIRQFDSDVALSVYHAQGGKVSLARVSLLRAGEKGSFLTKKKWLGCLALPGSLARAGSLTGTDAGSVGFRCFVLRTTISAVAATRPLFRKPPMGQASRTRHKAPEQSRPAAMAHGKEKSPRLFSSLKKTQNQNRYAAASCLLDLSSHQYSTAVTPAPKTIPQPNSRAMPLRVGTQMSARYSRKAPP